MAKGVAYDEETVARCVRAMEEGVPLASISEVEGVALPTLYTWRVRQTEREDVDLRTDLRSENERLRAENARLRLMVGKVMAMIDGVEDMRRRLELVAS